MRARAPLLRLRQLAARFREPQGRVFSAFHAGRAPSNALRVSVVRVPPRFVLKCTLKLAHLDLAVEDGVLSLDRADMTQQGGVEREVRRGGHP